MNVQDAPTPTPSQMALPLTAAALRAEPFQERAADGFPLGGFTWRQAATTPSRAVVIINAATSVRCRHYSRFADYLFANGFDVITYDYRGIGESRPASMKTLQASWSDWGALDFEAMLKRARREFPGQPIDVVGHSFGGCALGLAAVLYVVFFICLPRLYLGLHYPTDLLAGGGVGIALAVAANLAQSLHLQQQRAVRHDRAQTTKVDFLTVAREAGGGDDGDDA